MTASTYSNYFIPAQTFSEAAARISALTGAPIETTRGEKRSLLALRDSLELDFPTVRTNAALAEQLAEALDVRWDPREHVIRNSLTLDGVNAILRGATIAFRSGIVKRRNSQQQAHLTDDRWRDFQPARTKIEAVSRISALTNSGPEWLGPGSKEHKRVLINLASAIAPALDSASLSKTQLGASLARALNVPWGDESISTGETIRLRGLNALLAGAEEYYRVLGIDMARTVHTPKSEGALITAALKDGLPGGIWDGRECVKWLARQGLRGANDSEWQGFYFEGHARQVLAKLPPSASSPRVKYGHTIFDFSLNFVWDLKAHTQTYSARTGHPLSSTVILNDREAIQACVAEQGLGFIILSGRAVPDHDGSFREWQNARKGRPSAPSNSGRSRVRKAQFIPARIETFWISSTEDLDAALLSGVVRPWKQPRQAPKADGESGAERRAKMEMSLGHARQAHRVSKLDYPLSEIEVDRT